MLARIQPLRSFYLLYVLLLVFLGTLLGEYVLKTRTWRWILAFLPIGVGMFAAQRSLFPESAHIELPGVQSRNPWVQAFEWSRDNTPLDARFALDPDHMRIAGEDSNGFRAISQRSMLADVVKDSGAFRYFLRWPRNGCGRSRPKSTGRTFRSKTSNAYKRSMASTGWFCSSRCEPL